MTHNTTIRVPKEVVNKYRFVVLAGKRCEQLQLGAYPKIEVHVVTKRTDIKPDMPYLASFWSQVAVREIEEGRIAFEEPKIISILIDDDTTTPIEIEE